MRKAANPDGFKYWEYALIHTDDILVISHKAIVIMDGVDKVYSLKKESETKNSYHEPRI